jgi:FlaA1/EpsC-like NDP-sugar epimerase
VLQAAAIGDSGQVLVLDMGEPVKIVELARQMIRLAGHLEDEIRIEFSGLRAGEKLYEELLADADNTLPTRIERLRIARLQEDSASAERLLTALGAGSRLDEADAASARRLLVQAVPDFTPGPPPPEAATHTASPRE